MTVVPYHLSARPARSSTKVMRKNNRNGIQPNRTTSLSSQLEDISEIRWSPSERIECRNENVFSPL